MGNSLRCANEQCQSKYNPKRLMEGKETLLQRCPNCGTKYTEKQLRQHSSDFLNNPPHSLDHLILCDQLHSSPDARINYRNKRRTGPTHDINVEITCDKSITDCAMYKAIVAMLTAGKKFNEQTSSIKAYNTTEKLSTNDATHLMGQLIIFVSQKSRQYTIQTGCLLHGDQFKLYVSNENGIIYTVSVDDIVLNVDMIKTSHFRIFRRHNRTVFNKWKDSIHELQKVELFK